MRYVNAGHNAPFLLGANGATRLQATGVALRIVPDVVFDEAETTLAPGDRLVVFTDGISEALDVDEREYGEARREMVLDTHRDLTCAELVQRVEADVLAHCGSAPPYDDMTLVRRSLSAAPFRCTILFLTSQPILARGAERPKKAVHRFKYSDLR